LTAWYRLTAFVFTEILLSITCEDPIEAKTVDYFINPGVSARGMLWAVSGGECSIALFNPIPLSNNPPEYNPAAKLYWLISTANQPKEITL
jgi:hypothetical protein